jgi:aerobic carbon-monoxide dehydrogenase large subunit
VIGTSPLRKEDRRLLVGAGRFIDDLARPGLLHLGVVRSREAHARIAGVTRDAALAAPGVVAVWTGADLTDVAPAIPAVYGGSHKGRPFTQQILARGVVRYVGEAVAVVIADDPARLADAVERVSVDYEPLPALVTPQAAMASTARAHEGWPDNIALATRGAFGDVEQAMAGADVVVHERFRHPRLSCVSLETRGALAYPDPESGTLVVYASHQNLYSLRDAIAVVLGLPSEEVRVRLPDVGGGFGPKGSIYVEEIVTAAAARRLGRPVKWVESRREHLMATGHDRDQHHEIRVGFRRDGVIAAIDESFLADVGAYPTQGDGLTANTVNHLCAAYRVAHYRGVGTSVVTTTTPNAAYRAAGRPEAAFVMERALDVGARRLGIDPAEIRRRNLIRPEEMPYRPGLTYKDGVEIQYDPGDFPAAFERALSLLGYKEWRARQAQQRDATRRLGIGVACYLQGSGLGPYEGANVRVDPGGKVYVNIGVAAQGQGHATTLAQIAASELGALLEDVTVVAGDTALFPFGMGTGGSRVAANAGPAVARTAREVRAKAARVAADLLECAPEDVRIENGVAQVAGVPSKSIPLGRLAHVAVKAKSLLKGGGEPGLNACTYFSPGTVTWAFGTQAAVVEVDAETCAVKLLHYAVVHDPGCAINPAIVEGQLHGGAVQGLAAGLFEEIVYDSNGQILTGSLMDYAIPRAHDLPAIPVALEEHRSIINELGIKGVGESGAIPGAAAIANAIEDAVADLGVTIHEAPVTPVRLFALLRQARGAAKSP